MSVRVGAWREWARSSLWLLPAAAGVLALVAGWLIARIEVGPESAWGALAFQGSADDARSLLIDVTTTVVTVIALVLGLTVVALQLSSTQYSPRLLRNFIRDRPNQVALSVFAAAFVYSAAGLYTVGVTDGAPTESYPRLAVSGALVLLLATLATVVFFADHLIHSMQIDAITRRVERETLRVARDRLGTVQQRAAPAPAWAVTVLAPRSGYLQWVDAPGLLAVATRVPCTVRLLPRVGEHVIAGTPLALVWRPDQADPPPVPGEISRPLERVVRIGFERTMEQDAAFGIRQLVDMACKALSPAVNDPYTAVQATNHLGVIFAALAARPLGDDVATDPRSGAAVIVPGRRFAEYLATMCGLIRRYGSAEPTVSVALLRLLQTCALVVRDEEERWTALAEQGRLILVDARREVRQPADLEPVVAAAAALDATIHRARGQSPTQAGGAGQEG